MLGEWGSLCRLAGAETFRAQWENTTPFSSKRVGKRRREEEEEEEEGKRRRKGRGIKKEEEEGEKAKERKRRGGRWRQNLRK